MKQAHPDPGPSGQPDDSGSRTAQDLEEDLGVALMLRWQAGDESAFAELVEAYSGRVYSLLTRFLGPVSHREDLVQDVFMRVLRARDRYQATARFSTWIYRITFNLATNDRERAARRAHLSLDQGVDQEGGATLGDLCVDEQAELPEEILDRGDVVTAVRAAIDRLPETQRMALILARYDEMPYCEIAVVLDSTEKAIKSLIHRARENLRAMLDPYLQEEVA